MKKPGNARKSNIDCLMLPLLLFFKKCHYLFCKWWFWIFYDPET